MLLLGRSKGRYYEYMKQSDEDIAALIKNGDEAAFALLMTRYEPKLLRYGTRFIGSLGRDVLDQAVQDIFISAYQNIESFDASQRFSPWIYRIAHNTFVDILRKKTKERLYGFDFDTLLSHAVHEDTFAKEKENSEVRVLLEKGLSALPAPQREIITLYYFEELTYKEIADVLHVPISTVGVRLIRARAALKKKLPPSAASLLQ
jgi:RNA polymerase sigma-70 factor (ECF subfamily)